MANYLGIGLAYLINRGYNAYQNRKLKNDIENPTNYRYHHESQSFGGTLGPHHMPWANRKQAFKRLVNHIGLEPEHAEHLLTRVGGPAPVKASKKKQPNANAVAPMTPEERVYKVMHYVNNYKRLKKHAGKLKKKALKMQASGPPKPQVNQHYPHLNTPELGAKLADQHHKDVAGLLNVAKLSRTAAKSHLQTARSWGYNGERAPLIRDAYARLQKAKTVKKKLGEASLLEMPQKINISKKDFALTDNYSPRGVHVSTMDSGHHVYKHNSTVSPSSSTAYSAYDPHTNRVDMHVNGWHEGKTFTVGLVRGHPNSSIKANDFYKHLIMHHGMEIESDYRHSVGGQKTWKKMANDPDLKVKHRGGWLSFLHKGDKWDKNYADKYAHSRFKAKKKGWFK